ncbi:MAG: hypothetical protein M9924_18265 [Rhizobiaceae bacterium]|nr:hypothetical protein [Rhizobiaceae bacterium]
MTVDLELKFRQDGILVAALDDKMPLIENRSDPIFQIIVTLERAKIGEDMEGLAIAVGSVVQLNGINPEGQ